MVRRAPLAQFQPETGFAFVTRTHLPQLSAHTRPSSARVLEDGRPLPGPANALHDAIRQTGRGCFSFWHDYLYLSASDNTDPRTNGRRYEIEYSLDPVSALAFRVSDAWRARRKTAPPITGGGYDADVLLRIFERLGRTVTPDTKLLDFGCGAGQRVEGLRRKGCDAVGCDLTLPDDARETLRPIATDPYRLPYDDGSFDIVYSITVFEHVMDYDRALAEIRRVLRPGGVSVHVFPSRWKPIETHAYVPLASAIQSHWWLYLWALLGVRNEFQRGQSAAETAKANRRFLEQETNYLTKRQIRAHVLRHFAHCQFVEEAVCRPERYAFFRRHSSLLSVYRAWSSAINVRVLVSR
jgi:SAM-dependent methyltransferase